MDELDREPRALVDECGWTVAQLDLLHAAVGLDEDWQASIRRAELVERETNGEGK